MKKINVGIIGGAGYTGGELIRLLINHPVTTIRFIHSKSNSGNAVSSVHQDLLGDTDLSFTDTLQEDVDVLFLCMGHGEARKFLEENTFPASVRIIDLSQDFRLEKTASFNDRNFVYGLPELNREAIRKAENVANPGCFATCLQLGLLPLAKAGLLGEVHTTGITGSTGAGQGFSSSSHFSWRANNIQAYKTNSHQHIKEITQSVSSLDPSYPEKGQIYFVPWRGDFTRGIFISSQVDCSLDQEEVFDLFESFYKTHPFTHVSRDPIYLKQAVNTNKCILHPEKVGTKLIVHSVTDNLLKGASGQALQNMNLMFGLDETTGLHLKPAAF